MDCITVRRRLGVKHRSLRIWTGWAAWLASIVAMGWVYHSYVDQSSFQRGHSFSLSSFIQRQSPSSAALSGWRRHHSEDGRDGNHPSQAQASTPTTNRMQTPEPEVEMNQSPASFNPEDAEFMATQPTLSAAEACERMQDGIAAAGARKWSAAIPLLEQALGAYSGSTTLADAGSDACAELDAGMYALARSYAETDQFDLARRWTDELYATKRVAMAEPAYHLCRRLRETGQNALAYYYYRIATTFQRPSTASHRGIPVDPAIYDYLLAYEKSILWSYVGDIHERHARLHGLGLLVQLLENARVPQYLRESVFSNLQYYSVALRGSASILRSEKSIEEEWRYSTPTFLDADTTLIRVVNYYVADDGSYHVSAKAGDHVDTKLVMADSDAAFKVALSPAFQGHAAADHLLHSEAYILGLEDTRVVRDRAHNDTIYTLSASEEFSEDGRVMNQVLGVLDLEAKTHMVENVITGPYPDRHDKNWVFAGGIDHVVYGWYPSIELGAIDPAEATTLRLHTTIPSPASFMGMRGSTNGVLYQDEWWFVTHAVIHRPRRMRKYLHRLVVLDKALATVVRHSLPFTFEEHSDVEYCLGLKVDALGLTFGYSVRDRSSRVMHVGWMGLGELFD